MTKYSQRGRWVLFLTILVALGGCVTEEQVGRDFEMRRQESYQALARVTAEPNKPSEPEVIGGDLNVARCLELAEKNNKDLQSARLGLMQAQGRTQEAWATALPSATATGSALANDSSSRVIGTTQPSYGAGILLQQPLYLGGQTEAALDAAAVYSYLVRQQLRQTVQSVEFTIRQQYLAALLAAELERLARQDLKDSQDNLNEVRKRQQYGTSTRLDVLRAEVRVSEVEAQLIVQVNAAQVAIAALLNTVGVSQLSKVALTDRLEYQKMNVRPDDCLLEAMRRRPDLLIGEANIRLARDNITNEQSANRPKVYLQGLYQQNWSTLNAAASGGSGGSGGGGMNGCEPCRAG
jgi:outer membrane protein